MTTTIPGRIILSNGMVADGTGSALTHADVLISDGEIEAVVPVLQRPQTGYSGEHVDCTGRVVSPGFVDIHSHSDISLLAYPENSSRIEQGITTEVVGNCGMSAAPTGNRPEGLANVISTINVVPEYDWSWSNVAEWQSVLAETPLATNIATQVGHGSARFVVAGESGKELDASELRLLEKELSEAFESGCVGVSVGLMYAPGEGASAAEMALVAATAAKYDAVVSAHLRDYRAETLMSSIDELAIPVRQAGARLQISHLRAIGGSNRFDAVIDHIAALRTTMDIAADAYPYVHGHTTVSQLLPTQLRSQGTTEILGMCTAVPHEVAAMFEASGYRPDQVVIMKASQRPETVGLELGALPGNPWATLVNIFVDCLGDVDVAVESGIWPDVDLAMQVPWISIASDGTALGYEHRASVAHPRSWGAFPAAYRKMRELGLSVGEAVRRMTDAPAQRVNLTATVQPGAAANLTVFEDATFNTDATFAKPAQGARGLDHVIVNGTFVLKSQTRTTDLPGALLPHVPKGRIRVS